MSGLLCGLFLHDVQEQGKEQPQHQGRDQGGEEDILIGDEGLGAVVPDDRLGK